MLGSFYFKAPPAKSVVWFSDVNLAKGVGAVRKHDEAGTYSRIDAMSVLIMISLRISSRGMAPSLRQQNVSQGTRGALQSIG